MDESFDVVVIGGGAAGLSGAVALARFRRSVLVIDAGDPRNAPAAHVHNFLTRDDAAPSDLYAAGRGEVERYGGQLVRARVEAISRDGEVFQVGFAGRTVTARRLLVATGSWDELPDVPGLTVRWGIDVLHCPYCHGWEVRDRRIGVLAAGPMAVHQALLFRQLSAQVMLLQHTGPPPSAEQAEQLAALDVPVVAGTVVDTTISSDVLTGVRLADGTQVDLDAVVVAPVCRARAELLAPLGLRPTELLVDDYLIGTRIDADPTGATAVAGVWVAGNVADVQAQVVTSAAAGLSAAAAINRDLMAADAARAADDHYDREHGETAWNQRYREHRRTGSGEPNAAVVAELANLPPGTAFDAGAGEGGDALWLARQGWRVTAADLSGVALERGTRAAKEAGLDIDWQHLDLTREPVPGTFDLVTASYLHLPAARRPTVFARLAAAVAPDGTLLIIGHDPSDAHTTVPRPRLADMGWTTDEVAASLGDGWTIDTRHVRPRTTSDPDGREVTVHDAVLRAHRSPA
jgi:thioredoxin reductase